MSQTKKWGDTTSRRGEVSRIFVANICPRTTVCNDLVEIFQKYGKILGIDVNGNGFAFVQFGSVAEAQAAVAGENGKKFREKNIEVKIFDKGNQKKPKPNGRDRSRSPTSKTDRDRPNSRNASRFRERDNRGNRHRFTSPNQRNQFSNGPGPLFMNMNMGMGGGFDQNQMIPPGPGFPNPQMPPKGNLTNQLPSGGNEIEIIVADRSQWKYAEMLEQRIRAETSIRFVDLLFLHSMEFLTHTLNDLYERRTLFAIVITPIDEQNKSFTLHILYTQAEHRNLLIYDGIQLIQREYQNFMGQTHAQNPLGYAYKPNNDTSSNAPVGVPSSVFNLSGSPKPIPNPSGDPYTFGSNKPPMTTASYASGAADQDQRKLPDDVKYVLRTTIEDGTAQFLSPTQIDLVISYYTAERSRMTNEKQLPGINSHNVGSSGSMNAHGKESLLENPQIKAALNSLLQMGAINSKPSSSTIPSAVSAPIAYPSMSSNQNSEANNSPHMFRSGQDFGGNEPWQEQSGYPMNTNRNYADVHGYTTTGGPPVQYSSDGYSMPNIGMASDQNGRGMYQKTARASRFT